MSGLAAVEYYLNMFMVVSIVVLILTLGILYYLLKVRKFSSGAEKINYASYKRVDAMEFVAFDDIVSETDDFLSGAGMICMGRNVFVGGISIQGFNYFSASTDEQVSAILHSMSFANVIEDRVTLRQSVQAIDLADNISQHEEIVSNLVLVLLRLNDEYEDTLAYADDYVDDVDVYPVYEKQLLKLQKQINAKRHMLEEAQAVLRYLENLVLDGNQKKKKDSQVSSQLIFSYIFNPDSVSEELSKEEIYMKAFNELSIKAQAFMGVLSSCGCTCKRLSAGDLTVLMRKQCAPVSGEDFKLEDLFNSSYMSMLITCDSLYETVKRKIGEERFAAELRAYEERATAEEKARQMEARRAEYVTYEDVMNRMKEEELQYG